MTGYLYELSGGQKIKFEHKVDGFIDAHGTNVRELLAVLVSKLQFEIEKQAEYNHALQSALFELEAAQKSLEREFNSKEYYF